MTTMIERLEEYIAVRRSLGYDLSFTARVLRGFTAFADRECRSCHGRSVPALEGELRQGQQ